MRAPRAVGAEGQVRGAGRCSLSPRCELIIQIGCPGSGDWRPAPARRAISPAAHVTAALVRSAVHTSSSSSSPSSSFSTFSPPTPPPLAPAPRASHRLRAARHYQPRPPPGSPRARWHRETSAAGTWALVWATSHFRPPPPATHPSRPLPTAASGQPREREGVKPRERERERGREGTVL